jgi:ABC-2 type transport system permease protein
MKKLWLATSHEYTNSIRQKGYVVALLSFPLFIVLTVGLGMIIGSLEENSAPVGYVDNSGVLDNPFSIAEISESERVEFIHYTSEMKASEALESADIQAYFVLPQDYPKNKNIELFFYEQPGDNAFKDFYDFLQLNLLSEHQVGIRNRLALGNKLILRTPDGQRELPENGAGVNMFLPIIVSFAFVMLMMISSGYLMSGFMDEKSNRTIELMVTSLSPAQLVGSKLLTVLALGLTMLVTWFLVAVIAYIVGGKILGVTWLQGLSLDWRVVLSIVAIAIPTYIFAAALMLGIGLILGDKQEAESVGPLFFMASFIPIWLIVPMANDINGSLAVTLSFLPISSVLTMGFRNMFIQVPMWQVATSVAFQSLCAIGAIWLAIRTFRVGMLRYGKRVRWSELFVRANNSIGEEA